MRAACIIGLTAALGCGARTGLDNASTDEGPEVDPSGKTCAIDNDPPAAQSCGRVAMTIPIEAACELSRCASVDGEAFASLQRCEECVASPCGDEPFEDRRLLAMNRLGRGHVMAWCDSTRGEDLLEGLRPFEYLGGTQNPRVASVGGFPCKEGLENVTYLGLELPGRYGSAAELAAEWDVLIACGAGNHLGVADFGPGFVDIVPGFVHEEGRGLMAFYDYRCVGEPDEPSLAQLNAVVGLAGFLFTQIDLGHGEASIDLPCVADYR